MCCFVFRRGHKLTMPKDSASAKSLACRHLFSKALFFVFCFSPTTTIHTRNRACGGDSDSSRGGRRSVLLKFIASSCRRSRAMAQWRGRGQRRRGGDDDNNDDNNDDPALTIVHVRVSLIWILRLKMIKIISPGDGRRAVVYSHHYYIVILLSDIFENCIVARPRCRGYLIFLSQSGRTSNNIFFSRLAYCYLRISLESLY